MDPPPTFQDNRPNKMNDMNISVENCDVNGDYYYMNSSTGYVINNHNFIDYTNKRDGIYTNIYLRKKMDYRMV